MLRWNFIFLAAASLLGAAQAPKTLGMQSAPVTLEVFSDYQCPVCRTLYLETLQPLIADYVNTGKVYLVHHDFPLPMHAHAREAALYAIAALRVGKYEQVADALFQTQTSWAESGKVADAACSVLSAAEAKKVRLLVSDPGVVGDLNRDMAVAKQAGIDRTPVMVFTRNGQRHPVTGVVSYAILRRYVDNLIAH